MKPEEFVSLSLEVMPKVLVGLEKTMDKWVQKINDQGASIDPFAYINEISSRMDEEMKKHSEKIEAHGVSVKEFNNYNREHAQELERYLENHPEFRKEINEVKTDLNEIMNRGGFEKQ